MTLYLFARLHALPGKQDAVRGAIQDVQGPTRQETGCLDFHAFQSVHDPDEFYIHSLWQDEAAFDHHKKQPYTECFVATVEPLIDQALQASLTKRL